MSIFLPLCPKGLPFSFCKHYQSVFIAILCSIGRQQLKNDIIFLQCLHISLLLANVITRPNIVRMSFCRGLKWRQSKPHSPSLMTQVDPFRPDSFEKSQPLVSVRPIIPLSHSRKWPEMHCFCPFDRG